MASERSTGLPGGGEPDWLTLGQAAKYLGVAQSTIRKWSDQGRVPAFYTPGGHRRYRRADLDKFLESSGPGARERAGPTVLVVDDDDRMRVHAREPRARGLHGPRSRYRRRGNGGAGGRAAATADPPRRDDARRGRLGNAAAHPGAPRLDPRDHVQRAGRRALGRTRRGARCVGVRREAVRSAAADRPGEANPSALALSLARFAFRSGLAPSALALAGRPRTLCFHSGLRHRGVAAPTSM